MTWHNVVYRCLRFRVFRSADSASCLSTPCNYVYCNLSQRLVQGKELSFAIRSLVRCGEGVGPSWLSSEPRSRKPIRAVDLRVPHGTWLRMTWHSNRPWALAFLITHLPQTSHDPRQGTFSSASSASRISPPETDGAVCEAWRADRTKEWSLFGFMGEPWRPLEQANSLNLEVHGTHVFPVLTNALPKNWNLFLICVALVIEKVKCLGVIFLPNVCMCSLPAFSNLAAWVEPPEREKQCQENHTNLVFWSHQWFALKVWRQIALLAGPLCLLIQAAQLPPCSQFLSWGLLRRVPVRRPALPMAPEATTWLESQSSSPLTGLEVPVLKDKRQCWRSRWQTSLSPDCKPVC